MNDQYDSNQQYADAAQPQEQTNPIVKILIYVGILAVVNVVLIAVDAPFYIY